MIENALLVVRVAVIFLSLTLVTSCGSGSQAVQGTTLTFNPSEENQTTTPTTSASLVQQVYTITLRSPTGYPQIGATIVVDAPSGGTLYVVDTTGTTTTFTQVQYPHTATTDGNGVYTVALSFTSPVAANTAITVLEAFSGTAYNRTNVNYTCSATAPAVCPS